MTTPTKPETLDHAITRMRQQGFSDDQIAGQVQQWHPNWSPDQITKRTGILTGGKAQPKSFAQPGNGPSPNEPPVPVLQKHGFNGGISTFNDRVQTVVDNYQKSYGVQPPASLVFDLAKSPVHTDDFAHMFTVPLSSFAAKNRGIAIAHGYDPNAPIAPDAQHLADGILHSAQMGNLHDYLDQNAELIEDLSRGDKASAATLTGAIFKAKRYSLQHELALKVNDNSITPMEATDQLRAAGFLPSNDLMPVHGVVGELAKGIGQVADSLVHAPAGVYELGKAAGLDTSDQIDLALHGKANPLEIPTNVVLHGKRLHKIGEGMVKQTVQDVEHPGQNPGYLFLDILGVATPVAGGAARAAEAGRVLRAGEGAGAAARAFATKPLERATVRYGSYSEEMPLSQSPLVAAAQKYIIDRRNAATDAKLAGEADIPGPLRSALLPQVAQDFFDNQLSLPKKVGREADARKRIDFVVRTTLQRELDHVAGRAVMQARMLSKVPEKLRGGLTRGEQKAIQVLSWDDPDPLAAERAFHHRMIDLGVGDPKAHMRQLADLKLAQKAFENPSPRFRKALALTKQVVAEMEQAKIHDLGLSPEFADGRVVKAAQVLRGEELRGGARAEDESFYLPTQPRGKVKPGPSDRAGYYPTKAGAFGVPLPRDLPELTHQFSGKALQAGDYRIDATSLASEAYARTVRAVTVRAEHAKLWDAAHDTPDNIPSDFAVPIRDSATIPDKLRQVVARLDEGDFTESDAAVLPADMRDLISELYPDPRKLTAEEIQGVKWIDRRLLGEGASMPHVPGLGAKVAQAVQAPFRFTALYLRPAYILNKLGNAAMLLFDQGVHTVPNYIRALNAEDLYGAENVRTIRELVGAGKSRSFTASKSGAVSHAVAEFWNRVADRDERVASFVHYMRLKGYKTQEDVTRLMNDPAARADLNEVTRRANKALVEFDNLLPIEKDYIRHFIFVYPWVSRSAVWSIRAILEHPTKTAILSQLGREDMEDDPIFKAAPAWFKRVGYVPVGWNGDGTPKVINPTSVNTFSTLGDFLAMTRGATAGDKYASAEDFLGPLPKYFIHAASGRDEFGNQYPGSQWWDAAKEVLGGLPQLSAWDKAHPKAKKAGASFKLTDRSSLEASLNANLKKTVLSPGWLGGYGTLLAGGFSPREANLPSLDARYWADQNPKVRHARELDLLNRALDIQGQALGQDVPKDVRKAVSSQANIDFAYKIFLKATGRAPTDKERAVFTVKYLREHDLITPAEATKASKQLKTAVEASDVNRIKNSLLDKYAGGKALRQWDTDVRTVASFTPEVFNSKVATLHAQGLADQRKYNVSQEKLYDYGRKYVAFTHEAQKLRKSGASALELKAFADAHDVSVDGLPSFTRMSWANQTPKDQQDHINSIVTQSWGTLSGFDKALLGRPSDPKVTQGWVQLDKIIAQQREALAREGRTFPSGYARTLAKYVEKYYDAPGLTKDFDFSKLPAYERMKYLRPIQDSPNKGLWSQLFSVAGAYSKYLHAKDDTGQHSYSATQVRQMWKDYLGSSGFQAWLSEHPDFKAEINNYGKNTLAGLIG